MGVGQDQIPDILALCPELFPLYQGLSTDNRAVVFFLLLFNSNSSNIRIMKT
jgi:hypothetical protein